MSQLQIILNVYGGQIQDVFCSDPAAQVTVVDWDVDAESIRADGFVEARSVDGIRHQAQVVAIPACPLSDLAGTDAEQALETAEWSCQLA